MTGPADTIHQGRGCAVLLAALHGDAFPPDERWDEAAFAALLDQPHCFACVHEVFDPALGEAVPCGMALLRIAADEAELLTIGVRPAARGRGVGGALLTRSVAECAARGVRWIYLEVAPGNAPAHALYLRHGFTEAGRRRRYYQDGSDALVMLAPTDGDQPHALGAGLI